MRVFAALAALAAVLVSGPAAAGTLSVSNLTGPPDAPLRLSIPSLEITDTTLTEPALREALADPAKTAALFSTLDAGRIIAPEILLSYSVPAPEGTDAAAPVAITVSYRNVSLVGVRAGRATSFHVDESSVRFADASRFTLRDLNASAIDFTGLLGLYDAAAPAPDEDMRPIYDRFEIAGGTLSAPGVECEIGKTSAGAAEARPLKTSLDALTALAEAEQGAAADTPPSPELIRQVVDIYLDALTAYRVAPSALAGLSCTLTDPSGTMRFSAGPIRMDAVEPGIYPAISIDNLRVDAPDGHLALGNFTWKRMDFTGPIAVLRAAPVLDAAWLAANWRQLVPDLAGLSLAGLEMDIPDPQKPADRLRLTLGGFDLGLGTYQDGLPGHLSFALDRLNVPVTPEMTEAPFPELRARGISDLNLSLGGTADWDRDARTLVLTGLRLDTGGLGSITIGLSLGNVTEAVFSDNPDLASAAALRMTLRALTLDLTDGGLAGILLADAATESGQTPEAYRTGLSGMAQGLALAYLGNGEDALAVAQALGQFLNGAANLSLAVEARDEAGVTLAEFSLLETNPQALSGRFTVTATAGGAPVALPPRLPPSGETPAGGDTSLEDQKLRLKSAPPSP